MQANILALNAELNEKRNALRQQLHQRMDMAKHLHVEDISAKLPREVRDYLEQIVFTKEKTGKSCDKTLMRCMEDCLSI